jgi:hypothetical protein
MEDVENACNRWPIKASSAILPTSGWGRFDASELIRDEDGNVF